ncbi:unnamed protein product, partial [Rotaria magnacalcarata]
RVHGLTFSDHVHHHFFLLLLQSYSKRMVYVFVLEQVDHNDFQMKYIIVTPKHDCWENTKAHLINFFLYLRSNSSPYVAGMLIATKSKHMNKSSSPIFSQGHHHGFQI